MTHDPIESTSASREGRYVFGYIYRRCSMRLKPLMRHLRLEPGDFVAAIIDLSELYWIRIVWRSCPPARPPRTRAPTPTSTASAPPASAA